MNIAIKMGADCVYKHKNHAPYQNTDPKLYLSPMRYAHNIPVTQQ